ncbi:MAG TPA: heparinase II/III family protein, partial [Gemmatimonadales bacterium]|nr:heparinase II/III family protein [Gemmatimonadales bacterium]
MLTFEELEARKALVADDPDLGRLLGTLRSRTDRLLREMPPVPLIKAFLSRDGGICPADGAPLAFDPWSPDHHTCTRCGAVHTGARHHGHWARAQHLWLAERSADLALLSVFGDDHAAGDRAIALLQTYEATYFAVPNRDNVLGPSHLFFSTYLESLWLTSYLAAAFLLREAGRLPEDRVEGVNRVADEAARIIADFNEGLSNRQTWHAAALTAIAAWFGDGDLARTAVEERTGIVGHLADGFGEDGMWWEGENYHLFALRGLMQGIHWARAAGYDVLEDPEVRAHFREALLAPTRSALPDFTYPARRDSRYGVSLAEAPSLELWEIGRAWLGGDADLDAWLGALYGLEAPGGNRLLYDAWLHDAGRTVREPHRRSELSWWALTAMEPAPEPADVSPWRPGSTLLAGQGLAVLRHGDLYAGIECGREIGGHGHPDRLHLTLHAAGAHWLPDPGTGSYVEPVLEWYRSSLAHNAPRLDGVNAGGEDAWCEAFESDGSWAWCRARAGHFRRTVIATTGLLLDVLDIAPEAEGLVELPWHIDGELTVTSPGRWESAALEHSFVTNPQRFIPDARGW